MMPKKIYLNYVNEDDKEKTWSEEPVSVNDCEMQNREYTDLSQVWHDASEEPKNTCVIFENDRGCFRSFACDLPLPIDGLDWKDIVYCYSVKRWAYLSDILPKGGEQ